MIPPAQSARCSYESGRQPAEAGWLVHPGGHALTFRAIELAGLVEGARILDLGCGSGTSIEFLRTNGFDAFGIDLTLPSAPACEHRLVRGSAENLPFGDAFFNGVLAECSLSLMSHPAQALSECARVLRPGGVLMICDLYARAPESIAAVRNLKQACVSGVIVRTELEGWLSDAGFAVECFEDHSKALRESVAQFIFSHGSMDALWTTGADNSGAAEIAAAMKQVKASYFLLIASRTEPRIGSKRECYGE